MEASPKKKPELVFIAGSNGSGKSTLWEAISPDQWTDGSGQEYPFLNVDVKFKELLQANPHAQFSEATSWRNNEMTRLINNGQSFVAETVFDSGKIGYIKKAKNKGFSTAVHFMSVESPDMAVERVRIRVEKGGHDVPEATVRKKWADSLAAADSAVKRVDDMSFYDNSGHRPVEVAVFEYGNLVKLSQSPPNWLMKMPYVKNAIENFLQKPPQPPDSTPSSVTDLGPR